MHKISVDPDQLTSPEASWFGHTLFSKEGVGFWKSCTQCTWYFDFAGNLCIDIA